MTFRCLLAALGLAAASATLAIPAAADEAYICDAGRIVYVKPGELEHLKRTDPCIAGYYGLPFPAAPAERTAAAPARNKAVVDEAGTAAHAKTAANGLAMERAARTDAPAKTAAGMAQDATTPRTETPAPIPVPAAARASDFRNVLILNAASDAERIFRHVK
jgi:hypothetical protein